MATLFLNVSFLAEKDLIIGSDVATLFSKSRSFPKTNKDFPKAYKKSLLAKEKKKKKKRR